MVLMRQLVTFGMMALALLAGAAGVIAGSAASLSTSSLGCPPSGSSKKTIRGIPAQVYCGPAKATVTVGKRTFKVSNGRCDTTAGFLEVGIGVSRRPTSKLPLWNFLYISAEPKGGTDTHAATAVAYPGRYYVGPIVRVHVSAALTTGTFSGTAVQAVPQPLSNGAHQRVHGAFTCR